jgi:hypothetical protein
MGASVIPSTGSGSDNWVLISSVSPTSLASSVAFTSIAGYKKLLLKVVEPNTSATATFTLRFNSDSGANYSYAANSTSTTGGTSYPYSTGDTNATSIPLGSGAYGNTVSAFILINEANTTNVKTFSGAATWTVDSIGGAGTPNLTGQYYASAAITTVTFLTSSAFTSAGTVALYGVLA